MENNKNKFNAGSFLLYDSQTMPKSHYKHLSHFALTDALINYSGKYKQPIIHFWQSSPLVILGMMDTRIGRFQEGLEIFEGYEHDYIVRNSGGLAIVSDPGVLNVSLIYEQTLTINQAYEFMLNFVRETFYPHFPKKEIKAFEIKNSYCFGDYDLSIDGQKVAGISQRRIQNGVAIMIYISVNGNQNKRAEILKDFYDIGLDGSEPTGRYPKVKPEVMTTLEEAYQTDLSIEQVKKWMLSHFDWSKGSYSSEIMDNFDVALDKMYQRNKRFLSEDYIKNKLDRRK